MAFRRHVALGLLAGLTLAACVPDQIRQAEPRPVTAAALPLGQAVEPIGLARVISTIPRGTRLGSYYLGPGCIPASDETWEGDSGDLGTRGFNTQFFGALADQGYQVVGDPRRMFDQAAERASARYLVGAEIREIQLSLCNHSGPFRINVYGPRGDGYVKVNWQIYSLRERRVIHEVTTEGNSHTDTGSRDGAMVLVQQAFRAAASRLADNARLRDIASGREEPGVHTAALPTVASTAFELPAYSRFHGPIGSRASQVVAAGVSILSGAGHGSGFFVSDEGLILTNQHVVGDAEQVNVRLAAGVEVVGRVLRRDAVRDVALVKVDIARARPLPIGTSPPAVGVDVYTLGAPGDPRYAGTMTRGIVSALRIFNQGGVELTMIQSDATIHGGNSGGPLMDASGNVVGIAVSSAAPRGQVQAGTNFFIPIDDALRSLNIRLGQPRELRF